MKTTEITTLEIEMKEEKFIKWWDAVKDNECWNGAIVGDFFDDLWPDARKGLREIFDAAVAASGSVADESDGTD